MKVPSENRDCNVCGQPGILHLGSYVFWCKRCGSLDDCCTIQTPRYVTEKTGLDGSKMLTPETFEEIQTTPREGDNGDLEHDV